jgi:hypothetical protein
MDGGDAGNGLTGTAQIKGSGDDGSAKLLPPCCVKARAAAPESDAKCHATVVSGWFTEHRSRCGVSKLPITFLIFFCLITSIGPFVINIQSAVILSDRKLLLMQLKRVKFSTTTTQCGQVPVWPLPIFEMEIIYT